MSEEEITKLKFKWLRVCVLIPTYNNSNTLEEVIRKTLDYCDDVIVVNDGATDSTPQILAKFSNLHVIVHPENLGKGMALRNGFKKALEMGFDYVITIDSDGQHFPEDFIGFLNRVEEQPGSLIIGARNMNVDNVPGKSTFGNKFSNFWFWAETHISLPDTQSGYRLYPVQKLKKIWFFTTKFEFEIEVIVKAAWRGIPISSIPIKVFYAPKEKRVSHFKAGRDSVRISLLNSYLVVLSALFWRPVMLTRKFTWNNMKRIWRKDILAQHESALRKSTSVGVGLFFGIVPIWGFQFGLAILTAYLLKLNKIIVGVAANISVPPMIPFILYFSVKTGELVLNQKVDLSLRKMLSIETLRNVYVYLVGACVLSVIVAIFGFILTYFLLKIFKYNPKEKNG